MNLPIILASASPARLQLLKQIGISPDKVISADINETPKRHERPTHLAKRLAFEKANAIAAITDNGIIIGADTITVARGKIIDKAKDINDVRESLKKLSNRRHQVYTGLCIIKKHNGEIKIVRKLVKSILKFKPLFNDEIEYYCQLNEGIGKAGGCSFAGYAESFVSFMSGSFSNIIGLPLYETRNILRSMGLSLLIKPQ